MLNSAKRWDPLFLHAADSFIRNIYYPLRMPLHVRANQVQKPKELNPILATSESSED